jgi:hypothetical protein
VLVATSLLFGLLVSFHTSCQVCVFFVITAAILRCLVLGKSKAILVRGREGL